MIKQISKNSKRLYAILPAVAILFAIIPMQAAAAQTSSSRSGYIEIRSIDDLYDIRNDLTANYILMNDIDLTEATAVGGLYDHEGTGWKPLGTFSGVFDGNGHSIIGMRITIKAGSGDFGLFSKIKNGTVKNLGMKDGVITKNGSGYPHVGFIAGSMESGTIENCFNTGDITLTNVTAKNTANNQPMVGGLVGHTTRSNISISYNTGNISATCSSADKYSWTYAGGICGYSENSTRIKNCYNTGNISGSVLSSNGNGGSAGIGICLDSYVSYCYNIGTSYWAIAKYASITKSYNKKGCASTTTTTGTTALNESQLLYARFYEGFDFENIWVIYPDASYPYPQLRNNLQACVHELTYHKAAPPTCTKSGTVEYWSCGICGRNFGENDPYATEPLKTTEAPAKGHSLKNIPYLAPTTEAAGNEAHYVCSSCGALFWDAAGKRQTTEAEITIAKLLKLGDADGDGYVDAYDASLVSKYSIGIITASELNISVLDLDNDGFIDAFDASLIQKFSVGAISKFPIEE